MTTIKILGTGCAKCKQTEAVIRETLADIGVTADIVKVEDIEKIMAYDVMSTPAVVLDEKVMIRGKVPTREGNQGNVRLKRCLTGCRI
ncbi:MAG: TM0996/MTH895 family glutaredoxin-like protein [Acidobacteria bacterium]|nr:TM0996/MTH895 family glutaredoxin-like protein [Acidobacteriota bacterium]